MRLKEMREKAREALKGRWWQVLPIALLIQVIGVLYNAANTLIGGNVSIGANVTDGILRFIGIIVLYVVFILVSCILSYVFAGVSIKFNRGENTSFSEYLSKLSSQTGRAIKVSIYYLGYVLKRALWPIVVAIISLFLSAFGLSILSIVASIAYIIILVRVCVASLDYSLIYYLANDYEDVMLKELFDKSKELMYQNRAKMCVLPLTFIGWCLLAVIPIFVGAFVSNLIWQPYILFGEVISTVPYWANIIIELLALFIAPVTTYMMITTANFYESFKPQEIFDEGYIKPESKPTKYIVTISLVIALPIILIFFVNIFAMINMARII